jgi:hypothetical protein
MRSELVRGRDNRIWLLNWAFIISPPNLWPGFWQLIRSSSVSTSLGASSDRLRRCNLVVQGYHWWRELDLRLWPSDKVTVLPLQKFKHTDTEKGKKGEEQSQKQAYHFIWHHGDCAHRIRRGRPDCQFCMPLWRFTATAWKCAKTPPWTLVTKQSAVASRQRTVSHFLFR